MYQVTYKKAAQKFLKKVPVRISGLFKSGFKKLAEDIERVDLDIKYLSGSPYYRMRVGDYRAIYQLDNGELIITVFTVKPRGDAYKWLHK